MATRPKQIIQDHQAHHPGSSSKIIQDPAQSKTSVGDVQIYSTTKDPVTAHTGWRRKRYFLPIQDPATAVQVLEVRDTFDGNSAEADHPGSSSKIIQEHPAYHPGSSSKIIQDPAQSKTSVGDVQIYSTTKTFYPSKIRPQQFKCWR